MRCQVQTLCSSSSSLSLSNCFSITFTFSLVVSSEYHQFISCHVNLSIDLTQFKAIKFAQEYKTIYGKYCGLRLDPCAFIMHRRPIEIIIDIEN